MRFCSQGCWVLPSGMSEDMPMASFIWDISERNVPLMELRATSPLICCQYNQKNPDWLLVFRPGSTLSPRLPNSAKLYDTVVFASSSYMLNFYIWFWEVDGCHRYWFCTLLRNHVFFWDVVMNRPRRPSQNSFKPMNHVESPQIKQTCSHLISKMNLPSRSIVQLIEIG